MLSRRAFGASDEAQPSAVAFEQRRHALGEALAVLGLVEDMKAAPIEHQVEWAAGHPVPQKIRRRETTIELRASDFGAGPLDRSRGDVYPEDGKTLPGEPERVRARAAADIERPAPLDRTGTQKLDETLVRLCVQ